MTTTGKGFTVYHNGHLVNESDLIASGNPLEAPAPVQSEEWEIVEGWPQAGVEARWLKGKKQYRARAWIDDERFPGERGPVYSKEYKACDEADSVHAEGWNALGVGREQHQNDVSAAVARSHMKPDQAAMSDMRKYLKDLEHDLQRPYFLWQQAQARHVERMSQTASLRGEIAIMLADITEHGSTPEYDTFIAELQTLLGKGK